MLTKILDLKNEQEWTDWDMSMFAMDFIIHRIANGMQFLQYLQEMADEDNAGCEACGMFDKEPNSKYCSECYDPQAQE